MMKEKLYSRKQIRRKTILSFLVFFIFIAACLFLWKGMQQGPKENGTLKPLRKVLFVNETVFSRLFSYKHLSKTYSKDDLVKKVRINGLDGIRDTFNLSNWKLNIIRSSGDTLKLTLDEIKALPKTEIIINFKCIEGWSQVTHWGGVRFSDIVKRYGLQKEASLAYTGLATPDKKYYVGIDNESMMHPQTLLCYESEGKTLPINNGYPLRLMIPVKYGVKHLKRIGSIYFSNERPPDFWYERGYDYYCGL